MTTVETWICQKCDCNNLSTTIGTCGGAERKVQTCEVCQTYRPQNSFCSSCASEVELEIKDTLEFLDRRERQETSSCLMFCENCKGIVKIEEIFDRPGVNLLLAPSSSGPSDSSSSSCSLTPWHSESEFKNEMDRAIIESLKAATITEVLTPERKKEVAKETAKADFLRLQEDLKREARDAQVLRLMQQVEIKHVRDKKRERLALKERTAEKDAKLVQWHKEDWNEVDKKVEMLMEHIRAGRVDLVEQDLRSGILPWARDKDGISPVMMSVSYKKPEIFRLLMAWGADEHKVDNWGQDLHDYIFKHHEFLFQFADIIFKDNPRLVAILMGKKERLAKGTPIFDFFNDPIFDPNLITLLGTFIKPINFVC